MAQETLIDLVGHEALSSPETAWADQAYSQLEHLVDADILFDVDLTVYNGGSCDLQWYPDIDANVGTLRPGVIELFQLLKMKGNHINLWSRGSELHAQGVARLYGLEDLVSGCYRKGIITREDGGIRAVSSVQISDVIRETGFIPAATVDNDPKDRIIDAPDTIFVEVEDFVAPRPALLVSA